MTFKTLLIIKRYTSVPRYGSFPGTTVSMSDGEIAKITQTYRNLAPRWLTSTTGGEVSWQTDVKISNFPTNPTGTCSSGNFRLLPHDLKAELSRIPHGQYDSIFFYVDLRDDRSDGFLNCFAGDTFPTGTFDSTGISIVYANKADAQYWRTETFIHEWGHQLTAFYARFDVPMPFCGTNNPPIHCAPYYGYSPDPNSPPGVKHWSQWLSDFYNGRIGDSKLGSVGLGPKAWVHGTFLSSK